VPFEFLREIAQSELPMTVEDEALIDKLRVLRAADMVTVMLPSPGAPLQFARVLAITPQGRAALTSAVQIVTSDNTHPPGSYHHAHPELQ